MLDSIADARTLKITTLGRQTGKPHTVTIWFVAHGGKIYVSTNDLKLRDWARNLLANPEVSMEVAGQQLRGRACLIEDEELRGVVADIRRGKYHGAFPGAARIYFEISPGKE